MHAGRWATQHLIDLGHHHIAFMVSAEMQRTDLHYSVYDRRQGYEDALREAGLHPKAYLSRQYLTPWKRFVLILACSVWWNC
jgi:DNA-binding LacI/PurR family transcriptional regulator